MSRSGFAKARKRDSRGRFVKCHRPSITMMFTPTRDETRPMAVIATRRGFKGLFYRLSLAFRILIWGRIPVRMVENQIPYRDLTTLISPERVGAPTPTRDDDDES